MRILIAALSIGLAAATPPSHTRVIVDPPWPHAINPAEMAAHFCMARVLNYRVRMSVKAAKSELEWCYRTQLPRA